MQAFGTDVWTHRVRFILVLKHFDNPQHDYDYVKILMEFYLLTISFTHLCRVMAIHN